MRSAASLLALVLATGSAFAMDCTKAKTTIEKAICADPGALAADNEMSATFGRLRQGLSTDQSAVLLAKQREWLGQREYRCAERTGSALAACLKADAEAWTATLQGRAEAGAYDTTALQPVIMGKRAKRNGEYDVSIIVLKFRAPQTPAEHAFNAAVDALLKDAPLNQPREDGIDRKLSYDVSMRVTFASPALMSASAEIFADGGGAHPNTNTVHVNIDGRSGKPLTLGDVFTAEGRQAALKLCAKQIADQRKEKGVDEVAANAKPESADSSLTDSFGTMGNWSFQRDKTEVIFNPYELGSYAEGAYSCSFKNAELRPLTKPGFPLPN